MLHGVELIENCMELDISGSFRTQIPHLKTNFQRHLPQLHRVWTTFIFVTFPGRLKPMNRNRKTINLWSDEIELNPSFFSQAAHKNIFFSPILEIFLKVAKNDLSDFWNVYLLEILMQLNFSNGSSSRGPWAFSKLVWSKVNDEFWMMEWNMSCVLSGFLTVLNRSVP